MDKKKISILTIAIIIIASIPIPIILIFLPPSQTSGERKAIILCSANDFYRKEGEPDFNNGISANFSNEDPNWISNSTGGIGFRDNDLGHDGDNGVVKLLATGPGPANVNIEFIYNWTKIYPLVKFATYNFSAWVNLPTPVGIPGARIGLRWFNSTNDIVRTDWSNNITGLIGQWISLNVTGVAYNTINNEIIQLILVLSVQGIMNQNDFVYFDDTHIEKWFPPPASTIPIPNNDTDGFPAQALQVYWTLKNHGYTDDNIFLMLYHTGDIEIDINATDSVSNDLPNAAFIDVENDYVTASRFKQELNVSISGSFASKLHRNDQLIIFMADHGSNNVLPSKNATFHFEADDSYITELEFYNLVKDINVKRMMINVDFCYSGNFLNQGPNIGTSWYDIPNSILISSSSDSLSWYWRDNTNIDGFAGSWFFHQFWNQLNQSESVINAFNFAYNYTSSSAITSIGNLQTPLMQDNLGIANSWSFNGPDQL